MIASSPFDLSLQAIPMTRRSLTVLGSTTHFWEYADPAAVLASGATATATATTVVMVHGFRGDHHGLEPVVAQNLPGVRFVSADLPGFGESAPFVDRAHDIDGYADWLVAFVRQLAPTERVVMLGHSFGSIIVSAALARGLSADAVVLVNPIAAPALSGPRGVLTRLAVFYYWAGARLPERAGYALLQNRAIVRVMSVSMTKTRERPLRRWIHAEHDRYFSAFANRDVVLEAFTASVSHDVSEYATEIGIPTLLVAADRDDITPVAAQHRLLGLFPQASLTVIAGVGHLIHYEKPAAAAVAITAFLKTVFPGKASPETGTLSEAGPQ